MRIKRQEREVALQDPKLRWWEFHPIMEIDCLYNKCQALVAHIIRFWGRGKFHCFGDGLKDVCGKDVKKLFLFLQNMGKENPMSQVTHGVTFRSMFWNRKGSFLLTHSSWDLYLREHYLQGSLSRSHLSRSHQGEKKTSNNNNSVCHTVNDQ